MHDCDNDERLNLSEIRRDDDDIEALSAGGRSWFSDESPRTRLLDLLAAWRDDVQRPEEKR